MDWLKDLSTLGPALGSVAVLGAVTWKVLQILDKFTEAIEKFSKAIEGQSSAIDRNTEETKRMNLIIEKSYEYVPRKSHAHQ